MRDGSPRSSCLRNTTGTLPRTGDVSVDRWRTRLRATVLAELVEATKGLAWTRELLMALLEELHVTEEFDELIAHIDVDAHRDAPRLLALALCLRHSWDPADLSGTVARVLDPRRSAAHPSPTAGGDRHQRRRHRPHTPESRPRTRKERP